MNKVFKGRNSEDEALINNNIYAQSFSDFLNEFYHEDAETTKCTYWSIYKSFIFPIENIKKKFFYNFNREECVAILESISTNNKRVYKTLKSIMNTYNLWAIDRGYNATGINPMDDISMDDLKLPSNLVQKRYISKKDLIDKCEKILEAEISSPQHVIIWLLARYGVLNKKMYSAIANLKVSDIDFNNKKIKFFSDIDNDYRTVDIDDGMVRMLDRAIFGQVLRGYEHEFISNSEYVVKTKRTKGLTKMSESSINVRLFELKEVVREAHTLKDLQLCCKIDDLKKMKETKEVLNVDDFKEIQRKYGNSENSYSLLLDDYQLITGDDIERKKTGFDTTKIVRRKVNGEYVTNEDLNLTVEEMNRLYPASTSKLGRQRVRGYKKSKAN